MTADIKHAFVDLPLNLNCCVSLLILNVSSLFLKFGVNFWKKFRQGELHFSTEYDKTSLDLERKLINFYVSCDPAVTADGV